MNYSYELYEVADYEMVKHTFRKNISERKGIEF